MIIHDRDIRLAIFDLDGTLIDSTTLWDEIDVKFFAKRGMDVPPNYGKRIAHMGLKTGANWTKETFLPNESAEDILQEWKDACRRAYEEELPLKPNAVDALQALKDRGISLAVATANAREFYEPCLKRLGIYDYFEHILDVNTIDSGKDSSKIYDLLSERFGLKAESVLVLEDTFGPMATAMSAGYLVAGVYDDKSSFGPEDFAGKCSFFVPSWKDFIAKLG